MKFNLAIISNLISFFFALLSAGAYAQSNSSVDSENLDVLQLYGAVNPSSPTESIAMSEDIGGGYYIGDSVNGVPEGNGTWYQRSNAVNHSIYRGEFKNGLPNGFGSYSFENGVTYEGNWIDNIPNLGKWIRPSGGVWEGSTPNGYPEVLPGIAVYFDWPIHVSLVAAAMGMEAAFLDDQSSTNWYRIPGYNVEVAKKMYKAFASCKDGMSPTYEVYEADLRNDINNATRKSQRDTLVSALGTTQYLVNLMISAECLSRFALIMEGFGLNIVEANRNDYEFFYDDLLDLDDFHNKLATLMGMDSDEAVAKYGDSFDLWGNSGGVQAYTVSRNFLTYAGYFMEADTLVSATRFSNERTFIEMASEEPERNWEACKSFQGCQTLRDMYSGLNK